MASRDMSDVLILNRKTGRKVGRVVRVDYRPGLAHIGGVVYRKFGLLNRLAMLPLEGIRTMSTRVILADTQQSAKAKPLRIPREMPGSIYLSDGRYLGEAHSLMIDENTGMVEALVVRTSLLDDMRKGFLWLEEPGKLVATNNHIILLT